MRDMGGRQGTSLLLSCGPGRPFLPLARLSSILCVLVLMWGSASANLKCHPFPRGEITHNSTDHAVVGDVIQFEFQLNLNLSSTVSSVAVNVTGTSLRFCHNDSKESVTWELVTSDGTTFNRNSSELAQTEKAKEGAHELVMKAIGGNSYVLRGSFCMQISGSAGAGDLVQSVLKVTVTHSDNSTCRTSVSSPYFYLPPPQMWMSSGTAQPVPMMGRMDAEVSMRLSQSMSRLASSRVQVRMPSEQSSREVILTIQSVSNTHVTGFTTKSIDKIRGAESTLQSTYSSFQNDVGEIAFPPLDRDDANFSVADFSTQFTSRAEDYSELSNGDVVNVSSVVAIGNGDGNHVASETVSAKGSSNASGAFGSGANFIWVNSMPVTLQAPPLDLKRPKLVLRINQKPACAYDGETHGEVEVKIEHSKNSTASAYNVTARVYLTDAMTLLRHVNSEIRQNSLSLKQQGNVVNVDIQRMTFSDPTTVTLDLNISLTNPRASLADHYVVTAEAVFSDRWGNSSGMFTNMEFVSLKLDKVCSQRLNWTSTQKSCTCSHDKSRSDCVCCLHEACHCGHLNPDMCQPCDQLHLCRSYLQGFDAITELDAGDGKTTFVCAPYHFYRAWTKGISCYRRRGNSGSYTWAAVNPIVGAILSRDKKTGHLFGISNNGLARMRSVDQGVTWFTIHPDYYNVLSASANMENATLIYAGLKK